MSNGLAIAATTATLRSLLDIGLGKGSVEVTARPLDRARDSGASNKQINLFLYNTQIDGALRNQDISGKVKPGETGRPPLPLTLFYLVTAYNNEKDEVKSQMLLGQAMSVLHDHPLLGAAEIKDATDADVPGSDLHHQIERVRITPQPLPIDELSKLWTGFQTPYRTSAAYQVSVVLIESRRSAKTPLPVLKRGEADRGAIAEPGLIPPFPTLTELVLPPKQASALLGDTVTLRGHHLDQGTLTVHFNNPHLTDPVPFTVGATTSTEVPITLGGPNEAQKWVAGFYSVSLTLKDGDRERTTNELPLTIAPVVTSAPTSVMRTGPDNTAAITVTCSPEVRPAQRAALLWGDLEVPALAHTTQTDTLHFEIKQAPLGKRFLRLRIDGVDSFLIDPAADPPVFDPAKMLEIQ
jgi:Pvc16 N-terminal domain